ncbi:putative BEL1-like homeodomain protein 8 [Tripterygium wilfordii]|uniref:Putative BEL1-like homeodomain protein 8 n=1 Tax=Tripterygium wilfordii TaxID=458696 RepID=A0A7J7D6W5_TRIWF|nr:putative BEL1-like homeodomain protein 8 [Tripterygium wilfordii]
MATGAAQMLLQCVFDGSISMYDMEIDQRPYHRNCTCALHNLKGVCSNACSQSRKISFPKKEPWRNCSVSVTASRFASQFSLPRDLPVTNTEYAKEALRRQHMAMIERQVRN